MTRISFIVRSRPRMKGIVALIRTRDRTRIRAQRRAIVSFVGDTIVKTVILSSTLLYFKKLSETSCRYNRIILDDDFLRQKIQ